MESQEMFLPAKKGNLKLIKLIRKYVVKAGLASVETKRRTFSNDIRFSHKPKRERKKITTDIKYFLKTLCSGIIPNKPLVLIQYGGDINFFFDCACLSIFEECQYITELNNIIETFKQLQEEYKSVETISSIRVVSSNAEEFGDIWIVFDCRKLSSMNPLGKQKLLISSKINAPSVVSGISFTISSNESIILFKASLPQYFGEYCNVVDFIADFEKNRGKYYNDQCTLTKINEIKHNLFTDIGQSPDLTSELINALHIHFCDFVATDQTGVARNILAVKYFLLGFGQCLEKQVKKIGWDYGKDLDEFFRLKPFSWMLFFLLHNLDAASLLITAIFNYFENDVPGIFDLIPNIGEIQTVQVPHKVREILRESYHHILSNPQTLKRFKFLDKGEMLEDRSSVGDNCSNREEYNFEEDSESQSIVTSHYSQVPKELDLLISLIPDSVVLFPNEVRNRAETILGGIISIKRSVFKDNSLIDLARLVLTIRRHLSHKLWLFKGSGNKYTKEPPKLRLQFNSVISAGCSTDLLIYGESEIGYFPHLESINNTMAYKIIKGARLSVKERKALYYYDPYLTVNDSIDACYGPTVFWECKGRRMFPKVEFDLDEEDL